MLTVWTETCQPAVVRPADGLRQVGRLPVNDGALAIVEMDLQSLDAEVVSDRAGLVVGIPVSVLLGLPVQSEIGVDAEREGIVSGQGLQLGEALLVDPLLGDRGPAAADGRVHRLFRCVDLVVLAVADPVGVGIDEPRVRHVRADVQDRHLVAGERLHLVSGPDAGHLAVLNQQRLRDRRIVHRHDAADDDDVASAGFVGAGGARGCRGASRGAGRRRRGTRAAGGATDGNGEREQHR